MATQHVRGTTVTPTVGTDAYTAGDTVGGLISFAGLAPPMASGKIVNILVVDDAAQAEPYTLYLYWSKPSTVADDAAYTPSTTDLKKLISTVAVGTADYTTISDGTVNNSYAILGGHEDTEMVIPFVCDDGTIYMYAVAGATPDYAAATDLSFCMTVLLD